MGGTCKDTGCDAQHDASNGTCWCEWGCPHCTRATSKEKCSNLRRVLYGLGLNYTDDVRLCLKRHPQLCFTASKCLCALVVSNLLVFLHCGDRNNRFFKLCLNFAGFGNEPCPLGPIHTGGRTRCRTNSNIFPLILLACSVDTPIHINRSHLLALPCALRPESCVDWALHNAGSTVNARHSHSVWNSSFPAKI